MNELRVGIVGMGIMGSQHAGWIRKGEVPRCRLTAVCDVDPKALEKHADARQFGDAGALIGSGEVDAVVVATPHYSHTTIGIQALEAGLHLLVEKPISVHKADCERLIAARRSEKQVFAAMFNQRTAPFYRKLRDLIESGELGAIRRINWIITTWFRTSAYYASGGWRATWGGEGGGVLLNQCPHQLDLWQWLFGLPKSVRAHCAIGRYHDIEVEDDVTAFMEYENGATGVFITSTGEAPGTNRLEVVAERGRIVIEDDQLFYKRNEVPMSEFCRNTPEKFAKPVTWKVEIPVANRGGGHIEILRNFTDAILDGKPLLSPAEEGIRSVELANAMLLSAFEDRTVALPLDAAHYEEVLGEKIRSSTFVKQAGKPASVAEDFARSFSS